MLSSEQARWFSEHVQPHEPALRAYLAKRFPTLPDHDDLVQDTFVKALRAKESGYLTHAKAFLFTAARNGAIDLFRRRSKTPHEELVLLEEVPPLEEHAGVVELMERNQRLEMLLEAVEVLPPRCRDVMMLRYVSGLAIKDIAARLGISQETVKGHMVKGVKACTIFFEKRGLMDSPSVKEVVL